MLRASLYIIVCSAKNRLLVRLRRLREPRYLVGGIAGAAYLYFSVFMRMGAARRADRRGRPLVSPTALLLAYGGVVPFAGAALLLLAALSWVLPADSGLLAFSEAETNLLLPAPVTRRELLIHRLLRSQLPLLFGAVISSAFVPLGMGARLRFGIGMFVIFVTARIYYTGVTLARARLGAPAAAERRLAWTPLVAIIGVVTIVGLSIARVQRSMPAGGVGEFFSNAGRAIGTGPAAAVLWPFTTMVRPLAAASFSEFSARLGGSLAVLALTVVWVLLSDEAFQQNPDLLPQPMPGRQRAANMPRARTVGWALSLSGRPETLFLWKNAMRTLRGTNLLSVLPFAVPAIVFVVVFSTARMSTTGARGPAVALAMGSLVFAAFCAVLGPQAVRSDLRGDLRHLDVLKTWPVKSAAVIRGELLWPTVSLTLPAWFALVSATVFSAAAFPALPLVSRLSVSAAAVVLAPALIVAQLTVHNAAAVLFPAWVATGAQRPRGLDAMGQRLILFGGVILALIVMLGPGVIAGGIIVFAFYRLIGAVTFVPAAMICLAIVAAEIGLVTEMLGAAYDRVDLSEVERPE
jgi:ABC-2 type transport system permease protein